MTTINDLSVASSVNADDKLPIWQNANGVTRALPISVLDGRYLTADDIAQLAVDAKVEMFISSVLPNPLGLPTFVAGTTTSLTLANQYYSADNIEPFFDASFQGPDQYSLVGYGLNFTSPIPLGVQMVYVRGGAARIIGAPSDGTVTTPKIVDGAVTSSKLAGSAVVDAALAWGIGLRHNFSSIAQLRATTDARYQSCFVTGYYAALDGGGGPYEVDAADTSSADNGGSIIVDAIGRRWKLNGPADWYVEQFGAKGDGGTNDSPAIQAALNALPARGGTVRLMGKQYGIGAQITIGNGNAGTTTSTKNGIRLIGQGAGYGLAAPPSTNLQVLGGATPLIDTVLYVAGSISDVYLDGFMVYCSGNANTALKLAAAGGTQVRNVTLREYKLNGLWLHGGALPIGNYNTHNQFHNINASSTINGHVGLLLNGDNNDTWLTSFYNCRFDTTVATNAIAGYFGFSDSCSFYRCHFTGNNTGGVGLTGCYGAFFNAVGNGSFPGGHAFHDCSILTTFVNENSTDKIRVNTFINFGTYDNETIPTHANLRGITDTGVRFGGWGA